MRLIGIFAAICIFVACLGLFGLAASATAAAHEGDRYPQGARRLDARDHPAARAARARADRGRRRRRVDRRLARDAGVAVRLRVSRRAEPRLSAARRARRGRRRACSRLRCNPGAPRTAIPSRRCATNDSTPTLSTEGNSDENVLPFAPAALLAALAGPAAAQTNLAGTWQGRLEVAPGKTITIHFVIAAAPGGGYSAVVTSPDDGRDQEREREERQVRGQTG